MFNKPLRHDTLRNPYYESVHGATQISNHQQWAQPALRAFQRGTRERYVLILKLYSTFSLSLNNGESFLNSRRTQNRFLYYGMFTHAFTRYAGFG